MRLWIIFNLLLSLIVDAGVWPETPHTTSLPDPLVLPLDNMNETEACKNDPLTNDVLMFSEILFSDPSDDEAKERFLDDVLTSEGCADPERVAPYFLGLSAENFELFSTEEKDLLPASDLLPAPLVLDEKYNVNQAEHNVNQTEACKNDPLTNDVLMCSEILFSDPSDDEAKERFLDDVLTSEGCADPERVAPYFLSLGAENFELFSTEEKEGASSFYMRSLKQDDGL
jgi:hypothetical protein